MILLDEPTSALDPISTGKIEELIEQLRSEFTIVIVTHNMQQAARISQFTAFMYLGELVEFGPTTRMFMNPAQEADAGLHHRPLRLIEALKGEAYPMAEHIVSSYDNELQDLRRRISEMGGIAEKMLVESIAALVRRDTALAQAVIASDARLDVLQREVEENAILTIARRQPLAIDLRETISAIRISGDVERIGDLAKNIAKRALAIGGEFQPQKIVVGVQHMSDLVLGQLKDVLDAYAQQDTAKALDVWKRDGAIDALYTSLFRELLTYMMEDPRNISFCTHLLFCAKNIERIGDHTTNIAETVHYLVTGETLAIDRPKNDRSIDTTIGDREPDDGTSRSDRRGRGAADAAPALQSRGRRLRCRQRGPRRRGGDPPARAGARSRAARLDAAGPFRHRAVPAHPGAHARPSGCR